MMLDKKILIIDDKAVGDPMSSATLLKSVPEEFRSFIDYYETYKSLWYYVGDEIKAKIDLTHYSVVFMHDSFNDSLFIEGQKEKLVEIFSSETEIILFSGAKKEQSKAVKEVGGYYLISRGQYIFNFESFLDSYRYFKVNNIEFLYNSNLDPKRSKLEQLNESVISCLEVSLDKAVNSEAFDEMLTLKGYGNDKEKILRKIYENKDFSEDEFYNILNELLS